MNATEAAERLGELEAEALLIRSRIWEAADRGDLERVTQLYQRIEPLRVELLAARHVVARLARREARNYGHNPGLDAAEQRMAVELAKLGVEMPSALRGVLG